MLLWNCVHEILPVADTLSKYMESISRYCSRCSYIPETHLHLFRDCGDSSILWNFIFQRITVAKEVFLNSFFNLNWQQWMAYNLSLSRSWRMVFIVAVWHIWKARNRAVFELKMIKPFSVYNAFYVDYRENILMMQGKGAGNWLQKAPAWKPPAPSFLKLNIDGSWKEKDEAGGGGVFRSETGNWYIGFASKYNAITPLAAELYALREGLQMAVEYGVQKLEVETDAELLIKLLTSMEDYYHHELAPVIKDVACLMTRFSSFSITHLPRLFNKLAHCMGQYAISMALGHKVFLDPPPFTDVVYQTQLKQAKDSLKQMGESSSASQRREQVINLEIPPPPEEHPSITVTTEIMFGTIPTKVTTHLVSAKTASDAKKGQFSSDKE
ncbi:uncharacterized protein [Spinacia oleracea]|uniref:RNase H type-1 domain-containing protein n=1 Tax=Spinacia oleracea TaxID=3562 RepID=A0A9R0JVQ5_SPIOL|nr:uncharacterized protein LOC110788554 [Spinacia oleracea]